MTGTDNSYEGADALQATPTDLRSIVNTGNSANRIDMVFLGDGYTASQISTNYTSDIQNYLSYIFDDSALTQPLGRYEKFFNIWAVDVVSNQSGADDPTAGVVRDTALDASYLFDGVTQRLLYVNQTKATTAMNAALSGSGFSGEMRYVLVNDTQYGGGGGYFGVYAAGNGSARDVALHEIGHSFAGLADEYGGNTGTYSGAEPTQPDVTKDPTGAKWSEWLGYNDPVLGVVGAYEGGVYYDQGVYRPTLDSKMRELGRPFDPIARQEFIHKFYQYVDPLDSYADNNGTKFNLQTLSVSVIDPDVINVDWTVNGHVFVNSGQVFNFASHGFRNGSYTVTARAYDPTDWVRDDRSDLEESVSWTVVERFSTGDTIYTAVSYTLTSNQAIKFLSVIDPATTNAVDLAGNGFIQTITGNAGANRLDGKGGADSLTGLGGDDFYFVDNAADRVFESLHGGNDRVYASVSYTLAAGQEIETLVTTLPTGTTAINLTGNEFAQTIVANAGANTIDGKGGIDLMYGLGGNDIYYVDNSADRVFESVNGGNDRVYTSVSYALGAGQEIETFVTTLATATTAINLTCNEFAQTIVGNAGANIIDGKGGIDLMYGLGGNDFYYVDNASDRVFESVGGGNDRVYTSVSYALVAGQEIETFVTTLSTATTAINLIGNEFAQTIVGNAGANIIDGKGGNDLLYGSGGNDRFVFDTALNASTNVDRIFDFTSSTGAAGNVDKITLDDAIFAALNPTHVSTPFTLSATAFTLAAPLTAGQHVIYNPTNGALSYDDDGNGAHAAIQFAILTTHPALTNADFLVV